MRWAELPGGQISRLLVPRLRPGASAALDLREKGW